MATRAPRRGSHLFSIVSGQRWDPSSTLGRFLIRDRHAVSESGARGGVVAQGFIGLCIAFLLVNITIV